MSHTCLHTYIDIETYTSYDPTHTTSLRNAFARNMNRRFIGLAAAVNKAVYVEDVFGLNEEKLDVFTLPTPGKRAFAFLTDQEKIEAFMTWLREQVAKGVLQLAEFEQIGQAVRTAWTNLYVMDSYKRGIIRARYEMIKAGYPVPPLTETGGIGASMSTPFHMDRVGVLFTRVFTDLVGVTEAMAMQISRVLAQGMIDGDGARLIARKLIAIINGKGIGDLAIRDTLGRFIPAARRAEMIARTEMIRAFHLANIQEMRNWGVLGVTVKAELLTAGDDRVCIECSSLEGNIYTLDEAEGIIPIHPFCRCIMLPVIVKKAVTKQI